MPFIPFSVEKDEEVNDLKALVTEADQSGYYKWMIPRRQYEHSMNDLQMLFSGMPVLMPPDAIRLPLPDEPGHKWSWLAIEDGYWRETNTSATLSLEDLRQAYPGSVAVASDGNFMDLQPGVSPPTGTKSRIKAEILWQRLVDHGWIEILSEGLGELKHLEKPSLGEGFDAAEIERLLPKITRQIEPVERHAVFSERSVAREGWLKLTPTPNEPHGKLPGKPVEDENDILPLTS